MKKKSLLMLSTLMTFILVGPGTGMAAGTSKLTVEELTQLPPQKRIEYIKQQIEKQKSQLAGTAATLDATPPVLTAFNAGVGVNAARSGAQLSVNLTMTDDLSGIDYIYVNATSPSGQSAYGWKGFGYPASKSWIGKVGVDMSPFAEAGTWTVNYVGTQDLEGNWAYWDAAQLAALGNNQFTVTNTREDLVPPALTSGKILTPSVSLSTPPVGTDLNYAIPGVRVNVSDTGTAAVAGIAGMWAYFCLSDGSACFTVGDYHRKNGIQNYAFKAGTWLCGPTNPDCWSAQPTGDYFLHSLYIYDQANNWAYYLSTQFDGSTDFSAFFPTTSITINP